MSTSTENLTQQAIDILLEILEDTDVIQRRKYLKSLLEISYAQHLTKVIKELATRDCYGCQIDHPSQTEHYICTMTPFSEQVDLYLETALTVLNENLVILTWFDYLVKVQPQVRYHEISQYLNINWRWNTWIDDTWKANMALMLQELEEDPYCYDPILPA